MLFVAVLFDHRLSLLSCRPPFLCLAGLSACLPVYLPACRRYGVARNIDFVVADFFAGSLPAYLPPPLLAPTAGSSTRTGKLAVSSASNSDGGGGSGVGGGGDTVAAAASGGAGSKAFDVVYLAPPWGGCVHGCLPVSLSAFVVAGWRTGCVAAVFDGGATRGSWRRFSLPVIGISFGGCLLYTSPSPRDRG